MGKKFFSLWIPVILWAGIIFYFSSQPVVRTAFFDLQDFLLKKTAHLSEYFIFFVVLFRAMKNTWRLPQKKIFLLVLVFLIGYAFSDEFHQSFIPGREATLRDVMIDTSGGLISLWFLKYKLAKAPEKLKSWAKDWQLL